MQMKEVKKFRIPWSILSTMLLSGCFLFSSCLKNKDSTVNGPKSQLAVANYVVNGASFDIAIDNTKINTTPIGFGRGISSDTIPYVPVGAGINNLKLSSGTDIVINNNVALEAGVSYSLFLYDTLKNNRVKAWLITDNLVRIDSLAAVRFLQFIPRADTLTLLLTKGSVSYYVNESYIGHKFEPGTGKEFVPVPVGNYDITLQRKDTVIFKQSAVSMLPGKIYSIVSKGIKNGTGDYKENFTVVRHN